MNEVQMSIGSIAFALGQCKDELTERIFGAQRGLNIAKGIIQQQQKAWDNGIADYVGQNAFHETRHPFMHDLPNAAPRPYPLRTEISETVRHALNGFLFPQLY